MKIEKLMCIGSCCDGMFLSKQLGIREKGPVDNMLTLSGSILSIYKLFNGDFITSVLKDNYWFSDCNHWDNMQLCGFDGYCMIHNDYKLEKTKIELLKRIEIFNKYCEISKTNNNYFFLLCAGWEDINVSTKDKQKTINLLPSYVKNKLIVMNGRIKHYSLLSYPVFNYDTDEIRKPENQQDVQNKFSLWWEENKWFYENLNNCKYDNIKNGES